MRLSKADQLRIAVVAPCVTFGPALMVWPLNTLLGKYTPVVGAFMLVVGVGALFRFVQRLAGRINELSAASASTPKATERE